MKIACSIAALVCSISCATAQPLAAPKAAPLTAAGSVTLDADARALTGSWAEYWAVRGGADTQHYEFYEDGRFAWVAPAHAAANTSIRKTGTFALERQGTQASLVLQVANERFAPCDERCAHHDDGPRDVEHATPIVERYEIGECAPNQEAQALDAHYACRAIDGRAFWRNAQTQEPVRAGDDAKE